VPDRLGYSCLVQTVAFLLNSQLLALGSHNGTIKLWDTIIDKLHQIERYFTGNQTVTFSPNSQLLVLASFNTIELWDIMTGELYQTLEGHEDWVVAVAFSPDGQLLVSGSQDNTVKL
jgi:WD40 repeat protein